LNLQGDSCALVEFFLSHLLPGKEGNKMKKIMFLVGLIVFLPAMVFSQEKIEAPVWNIGEKWIFTGDGSIEVVKVDPSGCILKFSEGKCIFETQGYNAVFFQKPSLNRVKFLEGDKQTKYTRAYKKLFDFPLSIGKQWKDAYSTKSIMGPYAGRSSYDYSENFSALGWEDIETRAGKFKALKLEYKRKQTGSTSGWGDGDEIKNQYWYSPEVKYFVKCQYDKDWMKGLKELFNWELTSFKLKR